MYKCVSVLTQQWQLCPSCRTACKDVDPKPKASASQQCENECLYVKHVWVNALLSKWSCTRLSRVCSAVSSLTESGLRYGHLISETRCNSLMWANFDKSRDTAAERSSVQLLSSQWQHRALASLASWRSFKFKNLSMTHVRVIAILSARFTETTFGARFRMGNDLSSES